MTKQVDTEFVVQIGISTETGAARVQCRLQKLLSFQQKIKQCRMSYQMLLELLYFYLLLSVHYLYAPLSFQYFQMGYISKKTITAKEISRS